MRLRTRPPLLTYYLLVWFRGFTLSPGYCYLGAMTPGMLAYLACCGLG